MKTNTKATLSGERRYEKIQHLHSSADGFVELFRDKITGEKVAIKSIERGPKINKDVKSGILNHMSLLHSHIVAFKEVFLTATHLCIVMEYAAGGDALEFVRRRRTNEVQARWLFQQLIMALDYCHRMGIVCRDVKLENALLDGSTWPLLKINAFRHSKRLAVDEAPYETRGNPAYLAPELLKGDSRHQCYRGIDVWACGVFLYAMLFHSYPFCLPEDRKEPDQLRRALLRTMECKYHLPSNVPVSDECKDLIRRILTHRKERISMEAILHHPWFLRDLPEGAIDMNANLRLRKGTKLQSKIDITRIIDEASYVPRKQRE